MFKELDIIALTSPIPRDRIWDIPPNSPLNRNPVSDEGLRIGDVGTIVYMQDDGETFEVEFTEANGRTVAIATVTTAQARRATTGNTSNCRFDRKATTSAANSPRRPTAKP